MIERTEASAPAAAPARTWDVAIVGAGYVGVPLAHTFAGADDSLLAARHGRPNRSVAANTYGGEASRAAHR